jgi:hypothetical protein
MTTEYWLTGTSGDWSTATNWVSGVVPSATDDAVTNNAPSVIINGTTATNSLSLDNSTLTDSGTLTLLASQTVSDLPGDAPNAGIDYQVPVTSLHAVAPADGSGVEVVAASFAPVASAPSLTVLATLAHPAAWSFAVPIAEASIGSNGATSAQVQQALDESGLSVTGAGIKVGVLSDSFNDLGGATADEADGALPPASDIQVLKDLSSGGSDEGRAMMQIVHDIAPGASLAFYTADNSEQDFANGILALAAAGCKIICDDTGYEDEPFFQNGVIAQAIQTVESEGVCYLTAAGNDASVAYQAAWMPISGTYDGRTLTDAESFASSLVQTITVTASQSEPVPLLLEWNQAYGEATSDLEILVFHNGTLYGTATNQTSGEPTNSWVEFNLTASGTYQVAIENLSGPNPGLIKEIADGDGEPVTISGANAGTVYGHSMTPGAITVGAVNAADTPAFGVTPATSENFSSSGLGTELLFANNGTPLSSPDMLSPVAVSGVDNIHTTVSGLSDFDGTSAATASVAGVAALILSANPNLPPSEVDQILQASALAMANPAVSGAGLVQADVAVADALAYNSITELYVGYFDRAPDPSGETYWVTQLEGGMSLSQIAQSFSVQTESTNLYSFLGNPNTANTAAVEAFIVAVYANLFNRAPDTAGENYWVGQLQTGASTVGGEIINIISGAQANDLLTINNKVTVAEYYDMQIISHNVQFSLASAQAAMGAVTFNASSIATAEAIVNTYVATAPAASQSATASQAEVNVVGVTPSHDLALAA